MICPTAKVKFCPTGCFVAGAGQAAGLSRTREKPTSLPMASKNNGLPATRRPMTLNNKPEVDW
jgi:hypothetical protein